MGKPIYRHLMVTPFYNLCLRLPEGKRQELLGNEINYCLLMEELSRFCIAYGDYDSYVEWDYYYSRLLGMPLTDTQGRILEETCEEFFGSYSAVGGA